MWFATAYHMEGLFTCVIAMEETMKHQRAATGNVYKRSTSHAVISVGII